MAANCGGVLRFLDVLVEISIGGNRLPLWKRTELFSRSDAPRSLLCRTMVRVNCLAAIIFRKTRRWVVIFCKTHRRFFRQTPFLRGNFAGTLFAKKMLMQRSYCNRNPLFI